ncbi:MAG: hypothetical protein WBX01_13255 [Nitrososphaeraceae archaeon]
MAHRSLKEIAAGKGIQPPFKATDLLRHPHYKSGDAMDCDNIAIYLKKTDESKGQQIQNECLDK